MALLTCINISGDIERKRNVNDFSGYLGNWDIDDTQFDVVDSQGTISDCESIVGGFAVSEWDSHDSSDGTAQEVVFVISRGEEIVGLYSDSRGASPGMLTASIPSNVTCSCSAIITEMLCSLSNITRRTRVVSLRRGSLPP